MSPESATQMMQSVGVWKSDFQLDLMMEKRSSGLSHSFRPWRHDESAQSRSSWNWTSNFSLDLEPGDTDVHTDLFRLDSKACVGVKKQGAFTLTQALGEEVLASLAILRRQSDLYAANLNLHGYVKTAESQVEFLQSQNSTTEVGAWMISNEPFISWSPRIPVKTSRRGIARRAVFSDTQRQQLEDRFQHQKYISKPDRKQVAESLGLKDAQVKVWFQNRRMKWRNSKERELLASCSRYPTNQKFLENGRKLFTD